MKLKDQYEHLENQCQTLKKYLLEKWQTELKREFETFQKKQ